MFSDFEKFFEVSGKMGTRESDDLIDYFIRRFEGISIKEGLFTVFNTSDLGKWEDNIKLFFYNMSEEFRVFGYDWQGNCYGVVPQYLSTGKENVIMFEIGTNEILSFNCAFETFVNEFLITHWNEILVPDFFRDWKEKHIERPEYGKCIGYRKPLFLGGEDNIDNLEYSDMDVYWTVLTQVMLSLRR